MYNAEKIKFITDKLLRRETAAAAAAVTELLLIIAAVYAIVLSDLTVLKLLLTALTLVCVFYILGSRLPAAYKLSLCVIMLIFRNAGGVVWLFAACGKTVFGKTKPTGSSDTASLPVSTASAYLEGTGFPVRSSGKTAYYAWGDECFNEIVKAARSAKSSIWLEFFIISEGIALDTLSQALFERADAGVDVRILADGAGCAFTMPKDFVKAAGEHNVKIVRVNPLRPFPAAFSGQRDHRKTVIIDGIRAFCGGINIADEYFGMKERFGIWKDGGFCVTDEAAQSFAAMFADMWQKCTGESLSLPRRYDMISPGAEYDNVQPFCDSPLDAVPVSLNVYLSVIFSARRYLYITTPYLVCDDYFIGALCTASVRGVDVRLILPGIPDKKYVNILTKSRYEPLIDAGVGIYEYKPGFIHCKNLICDDICAVISTINTDYRSFSGNFECGAVFYSEKMISQVRADFEKTLKDCIIFNKADVYSNKPFVNIARLFLELLSPLM